MEKAKGTAGQGRPALGSAPKEAPKTPTTPTLNDLGISHKESSNWQKLAAVPEEQFEAALSCLGLRCGGHTEARGKRGYGNTGLAS